jgi:hypothetical protein
LYTALTTKIQIYLDNVDRHFQRVRGGHHSREREREEKKKTPSLSLEAEGRAVKYNSSLS